MSELIIADSLIRWPVLQIDEHCEFVATVECFGLWSDNDAEWFMLQSGDLFWTPSRAVATARLQQANEASLRVRSFDEWAESEGVVE